jgi:phosphate transport system substrate-binding protein
LLVALGGLLKMISYGRRGIAVLAVLLVAIAVAALWSPSRAAPTDTTGPGASATPPETNQAKRKELVFVGASTMGPFIDWSIKELQKTYDIPHPIEQLEGTAAGFKKFCEGVGPEFPDAVAATRPMRKDEFVDCQANRVFDIIEVRIGESAIAIVTKKGDPVFDVTPRMLYLALAAEVPKDGEFERNKAATWDAVSSKHSDVPKFPIRVLLPNETIGTRGFFDDRFLQGGCRHLPDIDAIFAAEARVKRCTTLRTDVVQEVGEPTIPNILAGLKDAAPGTIAVVDLLGYKENPDKLSLLTVNGILPDHKSIDDYSYIAVNPLIFYFKRAHMRNKEGKGVVRGIREFMATVTSDAAVGENGAFAQMGLEPYNEEEIAGIRDNVRRLRRYER